MLTVITPTYNRAYMIERTINSMLIQSYSDWEYIIIDDGSTDNTEEMIQTYLGDKRIRYIRKENTGAAHTRNVGVSYATGEFVTFLDSDDEALPGWLEEVARNIKDNTGIVCAGAIRVLEDGTTSEEYPYPVNFYGEMASVKFTCGSLIFKRSAFLQIGGYDLEMPTGLQSELGYRLLEYLNKANLKIVTISQCLVKIYVHAGPRLRSDWQTLHHDCTRFIAKTHDYFKQWDRKGLSNNYTVIAYYNYKMKKRKVSLLYMAKAIRYRPLRLSNYIRVVKYSFL
ncbi:MAG TPA: glycosyltransferase family A protein [Chitinophagaceae bacterium]|nr:glycosyltransferase family A protein [Chitinophagaceae bacterium]